MSPCRRGAELLLDGLSIFPGGELLVLVGPFDQQLLDGAGAVVVKTRLKHALRNLQHVVGVGQDGDAGRSRGRRRLEQ
jgi:hypothetical protein